MKQLVVLVKEGSALGDTFEQMMIIYIDIWRRSVSQKGSDEFMEKFRAFLVDSKRSVADIIKHAKKEGLIRQNVDAEHIATTLLALIDGMCLHHMILKKEFNVDGVCQAFLDSLFNGIRT